MDYGYSILMGIFSAAILLYAGLMAVTKSYRILPARATQSVKPKDEKRYVAQLAKAVAAAALSPAVSALTGIWNVIAALIVLVVSGIFFIWLGTRIMRKVQ